MNFLEHHMDSGGSVLKFFAHWERHNYDAMIKAFTDLKSGEIKKEVICDFSNLKSLDSYGALLVHKFVTKLRAMQHKVLVNKLDPKFQQLLGTVQLDIPILDKGHEDQRNFISSIGFESSRSWRELKNMITFFGHFIVSIIQSLTNPKYFYFKSFSAQCYKVGVTSLPIVGLLSFLIGIVMAYQGAEQLEKFGAEIFVVDLLGISILREIGVLITAIIIAGRVGSAFTAEIGMMQVNEEIDAIKLIGLDEYYSLINPRILALTFSMIFVVFFANIVGLMGGAVICDLVLNINYLQFYSRLETVVSLKNLGFGLVKAPIFGLMIGVLGCFHGLTVERKADAVGMKTTKSVVHSIFIIIVIDALFSILSTTW